MTHQLPTKRDVAARVPARTDQAAPDAITAARVDAALLSREGQRWAMPAADISSDVMAKLRASHGRRPLTPREPMPAGVIGSSLRWPVLAGGGLAAAAALVLAVMLPIAASPVGQSVIIHGSLTSPLGTSQRSPLHGTLAGASSHAAEGTAPADQAVAANAVDVRAEPLAEEARRLGDDTLRAADRVFSTLQVVPGDVGRTSEPAPR
jgi:hypothetical protein